MRDFCKIFDTYTRASRAERTARSESDAIGGGIPEP